MHCTLHVQLGSVALMLTVLISLTGCGGAVDASNAAGGAVAEPARAAATVLHLNVEGMHCTGCAATVRSTISRIDGVTRCTVSFEEASAEVVLDEDADVSAIIERITEAVSEDGFSVEPRET